MRFGKERVGSITADGVTYDIPLAVWRPTPYRPQFQMVWPERLEVQGGDRTEISGDPFVKFWHIDDFEAGEGQDRWEDNGEWHESLNVRPHPTENRLVLGPKGDKTNANGGGAHTESSRFGFALGKLWTCHDGAVHWWNVATGQWSVAWASISGGVATSIVDAETGTDVYVGSTDKKIYKIASGATVVHYNTGTGDDFTNAPVLRMFNGTLFALDGDDLYEVTAADTRTQVSDLAAGRSANYLSGTDIASDTFVPYNRITTSDRGIIWFQRLDNGVTMIWEYDFAADTTQVIGKLPVDFAMPYSITWSHGFVFIGFRYASYHSQEGPAYVYFERGAQRGVAPLRSLTGTTAAKPVLLAGALGDDLLMFYDGAIWQYNLSSGGISMFSDSGSTNDADVSECVVWGQEVFLANMNADQSAERWKRDTYTAQAGTWSSGRYNFGYRGIDKMLLDITVVTEPLPANTAVTLKVSTNGGAFTAVTGTHNTDDATEYTWTVSSSTTAVTGRDFEIQLGLSSTTQTVTPEVRSVTARAVPVEKQRSWVLEVDVADPDIGSSGVLANLAAIATHDGPVSFSNVWDGDEEDDATDYEVSLVEMVLPEADTEGDGAWAAIRLREVGYV